MESSLKFQESEARENGFVGSNDYDDMVDMLSLTEENLLRNIQSRFSRQLIYTYIGNILIAVNPYKKFGAYGVETMMQYDGKQIGDEPPHLFAIGSAAYAKMHNEMENQVVVISGESGSGKTESTKLLMQFLAASCNRGVQSPIAERVLEANPLLEAFGNAKTIRNDNSSRFGKYVELLFRSGDIVGARITVYLLEKSRVVTQSQDERNYHMFYELLSGLPEDERSHLSLRTAKDYVYLMEGDSNAILAKNDRKGFEDVLSALTHLGFTSDDSSTIYKIMSCILHLGNISFRKVPNAYQNEGVKIEDGNLMQIICGLLKLPLEGLYGALTTKVTEARNERLVTPLAFDQALETRDAFAKALYQRLFTWLVQRVNNVVKCENDQYNLTSIAILDIFGFEDFHTNSFEQLCINYANESLQYYFNEHIFRIEQAEYEKEQVTWVMIAYHDNRLVTDLIAKKPYGILHILDDESSFPSASDKSFLEKCHRIHSSDSFYTKPRMSGMEFCIKHYASDVSYDATHFLDKNRDTLRTDLVQLLIKSSNCLISEMFKELLETIFSKLTIKTATVRSAIKLRTSTVAASFNEELQNLLVTMAKCNPWFVRCVKPNSSKEAMMFDRDIVLKQLHYTGMLETVKIRKMGFPIRHRFSTFAQRYLTLVTRCKERNKSIANPTYSGNGKGDEGGLTELDYRNICELILNNLPPSWIHCWQIGVTKLFLRESLSNHLDRELERVKAEAAVTLQKYARGYVGQKQYRKIRNAIKLLQTQLQAWKTRKRFEEYRHSIVLLQSSARMMFQRKSYEKQKQKVKANELQEMHHQSNQELEIEEWQNQKGQQNIIESFVPIDFEITNALGKESEKEIMHRGRSKESRNRKASSDNLSPYGGNFYLRRESQGEGGRLSAHRSALSDDNSDDVRNDTEMAKWSRPARYRSTESLNNTGTADTRLFNWAPIPRIGNRASLFDHSSSSDSRSTYPVGCYVYPPANQLEIPAEMAFIFSKINGWQPRHSERNLRAIDDAAVRTKSFALPADLNAYVFSKYADTHGLDAFMAVHHSPIKKPFLPKSDEHDSRNSLSIFKLIQRYFVDSNITKDKDFVIIRYIVQKGLENFGLRDEIYLQICNLTFDNSRSANLMNRAWTLMASCLSCFRPSDALSKYLLKYASDHAFDGYKSLCQHKMLESEKFGDKFSRVYLPSILELVAVQERKRMALLAIFSDDLRLYGEVDSWMMGEEFASNLLQKRNISADDSCGWTVILHDQGHYYECSGCEFVLDLISEMEIPPGFSFGPSQCLVYSDRSRKSDYQNPFRDTAHDPDRPRIIKLDVVEPTEPVMLNEASYGMARAHSDTTYGDFSSSNYILNKPFGEMSHQNAISPLGVANVRYMNQTGYDSDVDTALTALDTNLFAQKASKTKPVSSMGATNVQNSGDVLQDREESSAFRHVVGHSQDLTEQQLKNPSRFTTHENRVSDMDRWLESVFEQALDGTVGDLEDDFLLASKIRGGGENEEIQQNQDLKRQNLSLRAQLIAQQIRNQTLQKDLESQQTKQTVTDSNAETNESDAEVNQLSPSSSASSAAIQQKGSNGNNAERIPVEPVLGSDVSVVATASPAVSKHSYSYIWPNAAEDGGLVSKTNANDGVGQYGGRVRFAAKLFEKVESYENVRERKDLAVPKGEGPPGKTEANSGASSPSLNYTRVPPTADSTSPPNIPIPPPPPPLPPSLRNLKPGVHPVTIRDRRGVERPIRVGKIQWPPPQEEVKKQEIEVGRLVIEEKTDDPNIPKRSTDELRQRISERILAAQQMAAQQHQLTRTSPITREYPKKPPVPLPEAPKSFTAKIAERQEIAVDGTAENQAEQPKPQPQFSNISHPPQSTTVTVDEAVQTSAPPTLSLKEVSSKGVAVQTSTPTPDTTAIPLFTSDNSGDILPAVGVTDLNIVKMPSKRFDLMSLEPVQTVLHPTSTEPFLTYENISWGLHVRKEVFLPKEQLLHPLLINLIFRQIVNDVHSNASIRISKEEKASMKSLLETARRNSDTESHKLSVIERAKKWPFYFSRMFAVSGGKRFPSAQFLGISHSGVRLVGRRSSRTDDVLSTIETIKFGDIVDVSTPKKNTLQIHYANNYVFLYSLMVEKIKEMIEMFCSEIEVEVVDGTQDIARKSSGSAESKYSMLNFAVLHFQNDPQRPEISDSEDLSSDEMSPGAHINENREEQRWRKCMKMTKWTENPIEVSLLNLDSPAQNQVARDCFINIMRFMNDYPLVDGMEPTECASFLLATCKAHPQLRDEIFCQLVKQTTDNRSNDPDSCMRGWFLLSLFASYYRCGDQLLPHLRKYLETNAHLSRAPHQAIAAQCLHNLQQTIKFGGRRCMPSKSELTAALCGRLANHLFCMLPGGVPAQITVTSSTVIQDAVAQVCETLHLKSYLENLEFTMYSIIGPDDYAQLQEKAYLMDVMTDLHSRKRDFFFLCQRTTWIFPLHFDGNKSYINLMYQQTRPDYIDGYLLTIPSKILPNHTRDEIVLLAVLQIQASEMKTTPHQKDLEIFIPVNAQRLSNISLSHWTSQVNDCLKNFRNLTPHECQIKFLEILSRWSKFGSTFFPIKSVSDDKVRGGSCLLAVNKQGLYFCSRKTNETLMYFPFHELLSARQRMHRSGTQFLDLKCGTLMQHKILELRTDKAEDLGLLIDQYIRVQRTVAENGLS